MFLNKKKRVNYNGVGIDIGNNSIKVAAVRKQRFEKRVNLTFVIEPIAKDASLEEKSELIRKSLDKAGISCKYANISVCGTDVSMRYIRLPLMRHYEIQSAIELEWDKYISLKKEEAVWDYNVLNKSADSTGKYLQILLIAAKKDFIEERINLLEKIGIEPKLINTDSLALAQAFKFMYPGKDKHTVVILNLGEYFTNEVVVKNNICWFSRDINIGGYDITRIISERQRISITEAESLKCSFDADKSTQIYEHIKSVLDNLISELKLSLEYLKKELGGEIGSVYICGGSSHLYDIENFFSKNMGMAVKKWETSDDFRLIQGFPSSDLNKYSPDLAVAVGLSLAKMASR